MREFYAAAWLVMAACGGDGESLVPGRDAASGAVSDAAIVADAAAMEAMGAPDAPADGPNRPPVISSLPENKLTIEIAAAPSFTALELTPGAVGSSSASTFSTLPTGDPKVFGFIGPDVRKVNFDATPDGTPIASGTTLTNEYAAIGVVMQNITVANSVFGGAASPPNATSSPFQMGFEQRFDFTVPVVAVGVVNTSPDQDRFEFYAPTGELIFSTRDQADQPGPNFNVDRFVGARSNNDRLIGSMRLANASGQIELDELVFEVSTEQQVFADYRYDVEASDPDGDPLVYTLSAAPVGAAVDASSGLVTWRPSSLDPGMYTFEVLVSDGRGGQAMQSFTVTVEVVKKTT